MTIRWRPESGGDVGSPCDCEILQWLRSTTHSKKMENGTSVDYQVPVEELEEEVPSDGTLAGASGTGAGSGAGVGAGAGFRLTTRFLAAFRAFFFIAFLAFFFFFAKTRFTKIMFRLWKPNNVSYQLRVSLLFRSKGRIPRKFPVFFPGDIRD